MLTAAVAKRRLQTLNPEHFYARVSEDFNHELVLRTSREHPDYAVGYSTLHGSWVSVDFAGAVFPERSLRAAVAWVRSRG